MVCADEPLLGLVIFKQWEIDDPDPGEVNAGLDLHVSRHLQAQLAENLVDDFRLVSCKAEQIPIFCAAALDQFLCNWRHKLRDTRINSRAGYFRDCKSLGAESL